MQIQAKEIKLIDIDLLIENPKNNNKHSQEQIERLAKLIKAHGFRNPITVSNRTGFIVCGHGRLEAAKLAGMKELPVIYQDFKNEAEEYAHMTADNAIALWAELDLESIKTDILEIPDIDIEMLGIEKFEILDEVKKDDERSEEKTLNEEQKTLINDAWSSWCGEIRESLALLEKISIFSQSHNKSFLKIAFLNALFLGKKIPRSATLGYQHHRMKCSGDGKNGSIFDLLRKIESQELSSERIRFSLSDKPSIEKLCTIAGVAMAGHKAPLDFPAELAKELYDEFAQHGHILDPCHGWGGRYLGFALSKAVSYTGVDASDLTSRGLYDMHSDLFQYHGKDAKLICSPYEDAEIEQNNFDFAMTSPPYFDREQYIGGDQAHERYKSYDEFIAGFYFALIEKTFKALKGGKFFALQVGNQKYDLDKKALEIAKKVGFQYIETRSTNMSAVGASSEDEIKEVLLIFKKP